MRKFQPAITFRSGMSPIPIRASVTLKDTNLTVDFEGTSPQVKGPFNAVPSSVLATVYYVIRAITDPAIPNNAGCFRPVRLLLPVGSLVNPNPPAAVNARSTTIKRIADVLLGALARALPDRIPAAPSGNLLSLPMGGVDPATGEAFSADSPYQRADIVRALFVAADALERSERFSRRRDDLPAKAGQPWSEDEDRKLLASFDSGDLGFVADAELAFPLRRNTFNVEGFKAHEENIVQARLGAGVEWRWR